MTFENLCFDYCVNVRLKVYKLTTYDYFYLQTQRIKFKTKNAQLFYKKSCCKNFSPNFDYVAY